jgi:hypothetical protein
MSFVSPGLIESDVCSCSHHLSQTKDTTTTAQITALVSQIDAIRSAGASWDHDSDSRNNILKAELAAAKAERDVLAVELAQAQAQAGTRQSLHMQQELNAVTEERDALAMELERRSQAWERQSSVDPEEAQAATSTLEGDTPETDQERRRREMEALRILKPVQVSARETPALGRSGRD